MNAPTRKEVEGVFVRLLSGELSRDEADRWATQWVGMDSPPDMDEPVWSALNRLCGCDLRHGPGKDYLHPDDQVAEWLEALRNAPG
jgi:hypothetical protein